MSSNFDENDRRSLVSEVRTMLLYTENSGNTDSIYRFSYAGGVSTYSFGIMQFDVGNNPAARAFLQSIGFTSSEIAQLSQSGGLSIATLVEQFISAADIATRNTLMSQILSKWTGSDTIDSTSRGFQL
jgi:hypothetical protein